MRQKANSKWDFCSNTRCLSSVSLPISSSVCISVSLTLQENGLLLSALSAKSTRPSFAGLSGMSSIKTTDGTFDLRAALFQGILKCRAVGSFLLCGDVLINANTQLRIINQKFCFHFHRGSLFLCAFWYTAISRRFVLDNYMFLRLLIIEPNWTDIMPE